MKVLELRNENGMRARLGTHGASLLSLETPDSDGNLGPVVLGFDDPDRYRGAHPHIGATAGRFANRIAHGRFSLDGRPVELVCNEGVHHLHGGAVGFGNVEWRASERDDAIVFEYTSEDGEQGYPGRLEVEVRYALSDANALRIDYRARTTATTVVNLTHHSYFNLRDGGRSSVLDHELWVAAEHFAPTDEAAAFMSSLYDELLPCFGSRRINIGCDETFDLGKGRSRDLCADHGSAHVYLGFLQRLFGGLHGRDRHVEFWGDIVLQHPELIGELPQEDLTALAWYYEAPRDAASIPDAVLDTLARFGWTRELMAGFSGHAPAFEKAGVPFQVCPGTSSWNTFVGRWSNARENIRDAVEWGLRCGAEGMLLTDWGDNGHLQPPCVSWPGLAWGAALSWCRDSNADLDLAEALGAHVFASRELAEVALELGDAYTAMGVESNNATPFFVAMRLPLDAQPNAFVLRGTPDRTKLEETAERLGAARERLGGDDGVSADLRQAAGLARHGTWRLLRGRLDAGPERSALGEDLAALVAGQRERWLATARPGGLEDSLARFETAEGEYREEPGH